VDKQRFRQPEIAWNSLRKPQFYHRKRQFIGVN
jgi:hypothetical protein